MTDHRVLARWLTFNGIGLLGMAVQLTLLAILVRFAGVHYLVATALAVEATLLHNFIWHQRWTWRDCPAGSAPATAVRLARFHLLNGSVSLAGNLACMSILTGSAGLDPIVANIVSVAACSSINFVGSHLLVFGSWRPRAAHVVALMVGLAIVPMRASGPNDDAPALQPSTLAAWQAYERQVDARHARAADETFFASDAFRRAPGWRRDATAGATPMFQLHAAVPDAAEPDVPDGRIHHWVAVTFVPGVTVEQVIRHLEAHAGQESRSYDDVIASRLIAREGDRLRVFLKLRRTKIITATYNTEHSVEYRRIADGRASSRSVATRIAELADAGTPDEREKTAAADSGYLWRLNAYWRYEQAPGGVLIECESVSLSRSIPSLLRPFVSGVVEGVARESLEKTLVSLRRVLTQPSASM